MEISSIDNIIPILGSIIGGGTLGVVVVKLLNRGIDRATAKKIEGQLTIDMVGASSDLVNQLKDQLNNTIRRLEKMEADYKDLKEDQQRLEIECIRLEGDNQRLTERVTRLEKENHELREENSRLIKEKGS